jgi:hypothetical protein
METLCELVRGPVYLTGEEVECSVKFTNCEDKGAVPIMNNHPLVKDLLHVKKNS